MKIFRYTGKSRLRGYRGQGVNTQKQNVPDMSQVDIEDRFKVLMEVVSEGEDITI